MIVSCGEKPHRMDICGSWKGNHGGKELLFEFSNDGTCVLSFKEKNSGSIEMVEGNFETDFSKKPILLSIKNIPQLNHPLYTIVEFKGNDSIRLADFSPRWRLCPLSFGRNTSMNLKRIKNNE